MIESNSDKSMHQKEESMISCLLIAHIDDIIFGSTNEELYCKVSLKYDEWINIFSQTPN